MSSSTTTMRSIFLGAALCWNVGAIVVGVLVGLHALSSNLDLVGGLSISFAAVTALQGIIGFVKLKQSLHRYIRFGLTSAAFSRMSSKLAIAWILTTVTGFGLYIGCLVEFLLASKSSVPGEASSGRLGVVWFMILGISMGSLILGMIVVSRISPWVSQLFVRTPYIEENDDS